MKYETLFEEFIKLFPDDEQKLLQIAEKKSVESSDGMHVVFGMVIVPFLMELLEQKNEKKLEKIFIFFEKMAEADDPMISEVLEFTVLEDIISKGKDILDLCKSYMKQRTLDSCFAVEKYMM